MAQSANRNASNLFGAPEPVKPVVAAPVAQPTTTEVVSAPAPVVAAASSPAAVAPAARITSMEGQQETAIPAGKHRDVHTSSRVLAPPGGHCHKIFG